MGCSFRIAGCVLLAILVGAPALAREDGAGFSVPGQIRDVTKASGGDAEAQTGTYVIAVNQSSNAQNGVVGQRIRQEIRGLMNGYLVDGEWLEVFAFQLTVDSVTQVKPTRFNPEQRQAAYDTIDSVAGTPGQRSGGSDLELAKYAVLRRMQAHAGRVTGVIFSNQDVSQQSSVNSARWTDDPGHKQQLHTLEAQLGVRWQKFPLSADVRRGNSFTTWVFVAVKPGAAAAMPVGRTSLVHTQNEHFPRVYPTDMTRVELVLPIAPPEGNRVHLAWKQPAYPCDGFDVLVREVGSIAPVATHPTTNLEETVEVPATGKRYQVSVAAIREPERERGQESQAVEFASEPPPPPESPAGIVLLFLLTAGVLTGVAVMARGVPVTVEGQKRILTFRGATLAIVSPGYAARGPRDVELSGALNLPPDQVFAVIQRSPLGSVSIRAGSTYLLSAGGASRAKILSLAGGVQTIQVRSNQDANPAAMLRVQVGSSKSPARTGGPAGPRGGKKPGPRRSGAR